MSETKHSITYAGKSIPFHLSYSYRKSLGIIVHPDGSVFVKAPLGTDETLIEGRVYKRAHWINQQLLYFSQFNPRTPKRRFVGGESYLYLGRKYRLKIRRSNTEGVLLKNGYFYISAVDNKPQHIAKLLEKWYRNKADIYFSKVLETCWWFFENKSLNKPTLKIRTMKTRWGSLSRKGRMTLNLELIKASRECTNMLLSMSYATCYTPITARRFMNCLLAYFPIGKTENINWNGLCRRVGHEFERYLSSKPISTLTALILISSPLPKNTHASLHLHRPRRKNKELR